MQTPNIHRLDPEKVAERIDKTLSKFYNFDFATFLKKTVKIWFYFLFLVFSLLFTIVTAIKISLFLWL